MYIRLIIILIFVGFFSNNLKSKELNIIRDAEIENFLKDISSILLESVEAKDKCTQVLISLQINYLSIYL